ncbi:MAG: M48 family metallopeptidase [Thermoplasmata archaeon]|nr:MAG: M48 family metallopeptidase [Thermoplasmata archaeon]
MRGKDIEIVRSRKRKKTVQAREENGKIYVYLPAGMSREEEKKYVDELVKKMERRKRRRELNSDESLSRRAQELNEKYFGGKLEFEIKYVTNQSRRFGSCTPQDKKIRISDRLADMPSWVRDYVIVHELAHLIQPDHSKKFWEMVNRYKYTERARGYLMAVGMESDD